MSETHRLRPNQRASLDRAPTGMPGSSAHRFTAAASAAGLDAASDTFRRHSRRARLLDAKDWIYLSSLLIPFAVFDIGLRSRLVFVAPVQPTVAGWIGLMLSPLLFLGGYTALWIGVFASARTRPIRWLRTLFQALSKVWASTAAMATIV